MSACLHNKELDAVTRLHLHRYTNACLLNQDAPGEAQCTTFACVVAAPRGPGTALLSARKVSTLFFNFF